MNIAASSACSPAILVRSSSYLHTFRPQTYFCADLWSSSRDFLLVGLRDVTPLIRATLLTHRTTPGCPPPDKWPPINTVASLRPTTRPTDQPQPQPLIADQFPGCSNLTNTHYKCRHLIAAFLQVALSATTQIDVGVQKYHRNTFPQVHRMTIEFVNESQW